jgi:endonuclease I
MKKIIFALFLLFPCVTFAQPPGYYSTAAGLSGQPLRQALRNIIRPHTVLSYTPGLWSAYSTTDRKPSGKLWDVYSDIPGGTPAYEYTMVIDQCGSTSPSAEHSCYNREHTWPQSKFASDTPMQNDLFIVYPTDYYVNFKRGNLPYGKVGTATYTSTNGSKIGNNVYPGAPSGNCFEPIDSFKGDLARNYFYVSTCYRNDSGRFSTWEIATLVSLKPWSAQMLLEWHHLDPVSKKEIDRNNAVYALQNNRNPFIDHPEYADCIWGTGTCTTTGLVESTVQQDVQIFPNPTTSNVTVAIPSNSEQASIAIYSIAGQLLGSYSVSGSAVIPTNHLPQGIYIVAVTSPSFSVTKRLIVADNK